MDFDEAIRAHATWKRRFSACLRARDHGIDVANLEVDDKCPLGCWIHGEGAKHGARPELVALKDAHARFHRAAAAVARKAESGQAVSEELVLGSDSDFAQASQAVVAALMTAKAADWMLAGSDGGWGL